MNPARSAAGSAVRGTPDGLIVQPRAPTGGNVTCFCPIWPET
jgi:hypothetical protein